MTMTLPPSIIAVKRKLGDEPLDLLYIQTEDQKLHTGAGKRRITDSVYRLVRERESNDSRAKLSPISQTKKATSTAHIRHTEVSAGAQVKEACPKPSSDKATTSHQPPLGTPGTSVNSTLKPDSQPPLSRISKRSVSPGYSREPRRFILTKERLSGAGSGRSSPRHGVHKRKDLLRNGVAVFSEQKLSKLRSVASVDQLIGPSPGHVLREATSQTFKKPGERKWRAENLKSQPPRSDRSVSPFLSSRSARGASQTSLQENEKESLKLAASLQQFALEASLHEERPNIVEPQNFHAFPGTQINTDTGASKESIRDDEDAAGYVYDRYVRDTMNMDETDQAAPSREHEGASTRIISPYSHATQYGVLVIRNEDKEDWEAFGKEDVDEDEEGYTEDEDSNAEDFYANDYPEADLSSGDEFDDPSAAYRTRPRGSGSEDEYDLANDAYSDDDSYGFSSGEEAQNDWRNLRGRRPGLRVENMAYGGDESA